MRDGWWVHRLFSSSDDGPVVLASWIFWVLASIVLHELAHGWTALWQGDDTPRRLGRMTINPLVHMGPHSLIMFAIIGIAWGQMPVNPHRFRWRRWGDILVSIAGPAMNLLLSFLCLTTLFLWEQHHSAGAEPLHSNVRTFLWLGGWLNIMLALFNMLPIPPLDGSRILAGFSRRIAVAYEKPQAQMFGLFILAAIFFTPLGGFIFAGIRIVAQGYIDTLQRLFG